MKTNKKDIPFENYKIKAKNISKEVDDYVSKHPYRSLGIAAGIGALIGIFLADRRG